MKKIVFFVFVAAIAAVDVRTQEITFTTTAANTVASRSTIDMPGLAGNSNAIIVATPTGNTATLNPHPIGAWYYNNKWNIFNTDHAMMPPGCTYKLQIFAQPGPSQFLHVVTKYTLGDEGSFIDEPALNNNPNATVRILQNHAPDNRAYNLNRLEARVDYVPASGKWLIKNINGRRMELNMSYNVVVSSGGAAVSDSRPALVATPSPIASNPYVNADAEAATALMLPAVPPRNEDISIPLVFDNLNEFPKKGLPPAAPLPFGNVDHAAAIMAQQILRSDDGSLPALLTALQAAGFTVIDKNAKVLLRPADGKGQGLNFYDFEAVGSLKIDRGGVTKIPLEKIAATITKQVPQMPARQFGELMLQDLRASAESVDNPYLRFWARLIIQLGNVPGNNIDIMDAPTSRVTLNTLQATLMLRRLQGVLFRLRNQTGFVPKQNNSRANFVPVLFRSEPPAFRFSADTSTMPTPCSLTGDQALIFDAAAIPLSTWGAGQIGQIHGGLGTGLGVANAAMAWGKLVASVMMLRGDIKVQRPLPLVRTMNATEGQKRLMVALVYSEITDLEVLNCVRPILNIATGLDFNMPTAGPLGNVAAEWKFGGDLEQSLDKFVGLKADAGAHPDPTKQVTSDLGLSKMWIVGAPKVPAVAYQANPVKVEKKAEVLFVIYMKSAKDTAQNVIDFSGAVIGVGVSMVQGDPWGLIGLLGSAAEIGYRSPIIAARTVVPVIDHEECKDGWTGTVTYTIITTAKSSERRKPSSTGMQNITGGHESVDHTISLSGTISINGGTGKNSTASANADETMVLSRLTTGKVLCSRKEGFRPFSSWETITDFGSGSASGFLDAQVLLGENNYQISFKPMNASGRVTRVGSGGAPGNCAGKKGGSSSSTYATTYGHDYVIGYGKYGPDRNKLSGSHSYNTVPTVAVTVTWNLKRCN